MPAKRGAIFDAGAGSMTLNLQPLRVRGHGEGPSFLADTSDTANPGDGALQTADTGYRRCSAGTADQEALVRKEVFHGRFRAARQACRTPRRTTCPCETETRCYYTDGQGFGLILSAHFSNTAVGTKYLTRRSRSSRAADGIAAPVVTTSPSNASSANGTSM